MTEAPALVSIVIVSFNARDHLRRCLTTLYQHQQGAFEVIVVDNASPDDSASMVQDEFPDVRLVRNATNTGFAAAANLGAVAARGDVIAFLNPDSELRNDAFSAPATYLRDHPEVGALGIKVLNPDGTLQLSVRRFPGLEAALFNRYSLFPRLLPNNRFSRRYLMTDWDHSTISRVDWVSGACVMTTRAVSVVRDSSRVEPAREDAGGRRRARPGPLTAPRRSWRRRAWSSPAPPRCARR